MRCSKCSQNTVVSIEMQVGDERLTFSRCSSCDTAQWAGDEGDRSLGDVLELARVAR